MNRSRSGRRTGQFIYQGYHSVHLGRRVWTHSLAGMNGHVALIATVSVYVHNIRHMIDISSIIGFDWDDGNACKNDKHAVTRSEAEQTFFDLRLLLVADPRHSMTEPRFHALGRTLDGRRLHVTFTVRGDGTLIRVISARDMHRKERMIYEQEA